jgi:hypothetical protein
MPRSEQDEFVVESQEPTARRSKFCGFRDFTDLADEWISASRFGYFFHLSGSGHVSILLLFMHELRLRMHISQMRYLALPYSKKYEQD